MVYLLHFHHKHKHAGHYLGYSESKASLKRRLWHHKHGNGAKLTRAVATSGNHWEVVRLWDGGRILERQLHLQKNNKFLCPVCNPLTWMKRAKESSIYPIQKENLS